MRVLARPKSSLEIARMDELYSNANGYYNWHSQRLYEVLRLVTYPQGVDVLEGKKEAGREDGISVGR